ncbi:MAG: hypothetical protein EOO24_24135, partial [Comamonadaceae bacterium]
MQHAHTATAAAMLPMVFLDGAVPGITPYRAGAPLWGRVLERFSQGTSVTTLEWATIAAHDATTPGFDGALAQVEQALRHLALGPCHLVAHDVAGLAALHIATSAPDLVAAVTVCSSVAACPTGDGVENLTLAHPPAPAGTRAGQRWAAERLSYSHLHIDDALLDAGAGVPAATQAPSATAWAGSVARAKNRLFALARAEGVPVPVQLVWGSHDPVAPLDQALWLFRVIAQRQPRTQFH